MTRGYHPLANQARSRIREYELLEQVGRGGMGAVYKARHIYLNKIRAIKIILGSLAVESEFADRFIREARILSELNHPNLVRLYEFGTLDEGNFFMVMEFVHGENLRTRIREKGRLSIETAAQICHDAAMGLYSAHQQGIVHRDISPDNILLVKDPNGEEVVKVIDFGIAKALAEAQKYTATNMFIGKPEYCSPEQTGFFENTPIDHRSDIYSLAINFYQMISGKLPFYSATPQGYLVKHANDPPMPIATHFKPGEVPEELDRVLRKALAKSPSDRYQSMLEFAHELKRIQNAADKLEGTKALSDPAQWFQEYFELGKKSYDKLEWMEAIRWWNKAQKVSPDPVVQDWIASAQERFRLEKEVRSTLSNELEECEVQVYQGNQARAAQLLQHVEQSLSPDLNLGDLHTRVQTIRERFTQPPATSKQVQPSSNTWNIALLIGAIGIILLFGIGVIAFFVIPRMNGGQQQSEIHEIKEEVRSLIEQNRFRDARKKLLLLEEKGMDASDPYYVELERLLKRREQERGAALYQEAETAFNASNIPLANQKLQELESLNLPSFETQVSGLKERMRQYSESADVLDRTRTPLMKAMVNGDIYLTRQLMDQGADINAADGNGYTVLMYAIWKTPDLATELIRRGAKVNTRDNRNVTPLHVSADVGHYPSAEMLVQYGAYLDVQNMYGATPLIVAATSGRTQVARLLIDQGADLNMKTTNGYDALMTAEYYKHTETADLIRSKQNPPQRIKAFKKSSTATRKD